MGSSGSVLRLVLTCSLGKWSQELRTSGRSNSLGIMTVERGDTLEVGELKKTSVCRPGERPLPPSNDENLRSDEVHRRPTVTLKEFTEQTTSIT